MSSHTTKPADHAPDAIKLTSTDSISLNPNLGVYRKGTAAKLPQQIHPDPVRLKASLY